MDFLISKEIMGNIIDFKAINERIITITITIRLNIRYKIQIIQIYAPTTSHDDKEAEDFYELLDNTIKEKSNGTVIMGNFKAKVGTSSDNAEKFTGKFGTGARNKRGERLMEFVAYKKVSIESTFFKRKSSKR